MRNLFFCMASLAQNIKLALNMKDSQVFCFFKRKII